MILSKDNVVCMGSMLLIGLAGCGNVPQQSQAANSVAPSITENTSSKNIPEPQQEISPSATTAAVEGDIWSQLRQADTHYYILMRHAIAPGTGDPPTFQLGDCSTQRNLSEAGITQARLTGDAFREQRVAVQQVLSSEWCRCLDTAISMELGLVQPLPALNSFFQNRAEEPQRTQALQQFMLDQQDQPGVTLLVTHFVNIVAISGSGVSSGEIVVMRVNDQNEPEIVGQIEPF